MSEPYIGEIRLVAFNFAPVGWAFCDGSVLAIAQNDALFALIGTTYGGDGQNTFALPDLRSRLPVHTGNPPVGSIQLGEAGGAETVTLTTQQIPAHTHSARSNVASSSATPDGKYWAGNAGTPSYADPSGSVFMAAGTIGQSGGSQSHENMPPFLTINFIIALFGIFPSQN